MLARDCSAAGGDTVPDKAPLLIDGQSARRRFVMDRSLCDRLVHRCPSSVAASRRGPKTAASFPAARHRHRHCSAFIALVMALLIGFPHRFFIPPLVWLLGSSGVLALRQRAAAAVVPCCCGGLVTQTAATGRRGQRPVAKTRRINVSRP